MHVSLGGTPAGRAALIAGAALLVASLATLPRDHLRAVITAPAGEVSYELSGTPASRSANERVAWWIDRYRSQLAAAERRWRVDRRAIAAVVAYEALENREPSYATYLSRASGPGKLHYKEYYVGGEGVPVTKEVEDLGYLPRQTLLRRKAIVETDDGAIRYIGAIMRAFSDVATANGYDLHCDDAMLATFYSAWTVRSAKRRLPEIRPRSLRPNDVGDWVAAHAAELGAQTGASTICGNAKTTSTTP